MSAETLIQYLSWAIYLITFIVTAVRAIHQPLRAKVDTALLFSAPALLILLSLASQANLLEKSALYTDITVLLLLLIPYLLLRVVYDFYNVPAWFMRLSEVVLAVLVIGTFFFGSALPIWFLSLLIVYLALLPVYSVVAFVQAARSGKGVTRRRMVAAALGSLFFLSIFILAGTSLWFPSLAGISATASNLCGLASAVCYYLGFAPPSFLRRAWQEPELRAFLGRAATLPRLPDTLSIAQEIEKWTAQSVGAPNARIGLWNPAREQLDFSGDASLVPSKSMVAGRAFLEQRALFEPHVHAENPTQREMLQRYGANAIMAAPITAGARPLGVLVAYAQRAPIFAEEDLALLQLLADQAAVILESRALIDEATRVRAREEATRLKDDFLSAAAHDLKTPLTTLVGQTQLLERRALRSPTAPADLDGIRRVAKEAQRLRTLVLELLDAARAEQGRLVSEREPLNLVELAQEVCTRHSSGRYQCVVEADSPAQGEYDRTRISQLIENLVENAVKYMPDGGQVDIKIWQAGDTNYITVSDSGIGIAPEDLPYIFDRFHRGGNVDDRRFAGMGLGLYICRAIVEQHGGSITAQSKPGEGAVFTVELPVEATTPQKEVDMAQVNA